MELSSNRFKSFAVTIGLSFWFFVITTTIGIFSTVYLGVFFVITLLVSQIFSKQLSKGLEKFAIFNTKFFLGILFITVISIYGIVFRILRVDLLRNKKKNDSYWLKIDQLPADRFLKQY